MTKEELLFIHLLENNHHRDRYVVSELITEQGIKITLDCDISLISRLLNKNEKKGYIYRMLMKVENKKRKQNAFFLTEKGLNLAEELYEKYPNFEFKKEKVSVTQKCLKEF